MDIWITFAIDSRTRSVSNPNGVLQIVEIKMLCYSLGIIMAKVYPRYLLFRTIFDVSIRLSDERLILR